MTPEQCSEMSDTLLEKATDLEIPHVPTYIMYKHDDVDDDLPAIEYRIRSAFSERLVKKVVVFILEEE